MNFKEIIGPDELDWKVIPLDWEKIGKDELKLGTPMSKDGVEANDASCYGILMDDVQKDKHFQARVIVSGCVDFAKAEEYSGIKISAEAKKAIGKVWSQGGGASSWNDLTDKPFGKEQGEILPETKLTADSSGGMYIASAFDMIIGKQYTVNWNGAEYNCTAQAFTYPNGTVVTCVGDIGSATGGESTGEPFVIMRVPDETVAQTGFYAMVMPADGSTSATVSITGEVVRQMSSEYLKLGNGLTVDENGAIALSLPNAEGGSF